MRVIRYEQFLTPGQTEVTIPPGYRAVAIHSTSQCDIADVNGFRLGVGSILPLTGGQASARAVRCPPPEIDGDNGLAECSGHLSLALYEACDELVPPGPRVATYGRAVIADAALAATLATAQPALRLPFQGRSQAAIRFKRTDGTVDLSMVVVGVMYGYREWFTDAQLAGGTGEPEYYVSDPVTWWDGGGAAPTIGAANPLNTEHAWRAVNLGGQGDAIDPFDELAIYIFGAAGVGNCVSLVSAEAFGERLK